MTPRRWQVGIIPCTSTKNPNATTARSLYRGGPFATMMTHARQRCDRIFIMSALFGLIPEDHSVHYYDLYLGDHTKAQRAEYLRLLAPQSAELRGMLRIDPDGSRYQVLSYLPQMYHDVLMEADPILKHWYRRPYAHIRSLTMFSILSNEIKNYGLLPARR